jgi:biotin carboxyl carrier protein
MGSHRADHRAPRPATTTPDSGSAYVGKRVAQRVETEVPASTSSYVGKRVARPATPATPAPAPAPAPAPVVIAPVVDRAPTVELPALRDIAASDPLTDSSASLRAVPAGGGKRRAVKHAGARGPLFRGLPTLPVAAGVATLAIAVTGVVTSSDPQLASASDHVTAANALTGSFGSGAVGTRGETVSRDSDRDALAQAAGTDLVAEAERSAAERTSALGNLAQAAEKEAAEIALNRWVLPIAPGAYHLTARFGEYGLWSHYHTGLDFAAPTGTPIHAITNGVVTSASFDGAYGNKTVLTLDDGTELWFCHQSAFNVSVGDKVRAGDLIGYVGGTGHVTGPHLHVEVRPGGGDPVDPDAALRQHGVTP